MSRNYFAERQMEALKEGNVAIIDPFVDRGGRGVQVILSYGRSTRIPTTRALAAWTAACTKAGVDLGAFTPEAPTPAQAMARVVQYRVCLGEKKKLANHTYYDWKKVGDSFRMAEAGGECTIQLDKVVVDEHAKRADTSRIGAMRFVQGPVGQGYPFEIHFEGNVPPKLQDALRDAHHSYWMNFVPSDFTSTITALGDAHYAIPLRETGGVYFFPNIGDALAVAEVISSWCRNSFNRNEAVRLKNYNGTDPREIAEDRNAIIGGVQDDLASSIEQLAKKVQAVNETVQAEGNVRSSTMTKRLEEVEAAMAKADLYGDLLDAKLDKHLGSLGKIKAAFEAYKSLAELSE